MATTFDVQSARKHFPSLSQPQVFFDNAGGSQILGEVAESIKNYLCTNNVQLGATYDAGQQSTDAYNKGIAAGAKYVNAATDEIVIGPSTTQLFRNVSLALVPYLQSHPAPEIILSASDHEANIASWIFLPILVPKIMVKWWKPELLPSTGSSNPQSKNPHLTPKSLEPLLSENTVLVTCTHTSNILGTITDIPALSELIHKASPSAMLCVDGVAYSPHRSLDLANLGADIYSFSWYKLCGPHVAQMYVKRSAQDRFLRSLGHYFKEGWSLEEKLGLAGSSYELVAALPQVTEYLGSGFSGAASRGWHDAARHEAEIAEVLLSYLRSKSEVYSIFGEPTGDVERRVPVISFKAKGRKSRDVVEKVEKRTSYGFRWGHFYSKRLLEDILGFEDPDDGVIRVSMFHYNTKEEIEGFVKELDAEVCGAK